MSVTCPMCLTVVAKLKSDSHVLPKFFLKPIRDHHGQIQTINVFKVIIDHKSQDLPKGSYICASCESLTSVFDGYGAKVLNRAIELNLNAYDVPFGKITFEHLSGFDFKQFRNFLLSVVLRDHCWRKSEGIAPILTDKKYEEMRSLALSNDSTDEQSFRIIMHKIEPTLVPNLHLVTSPPVGSALGDAVTFMGLGYAFMVYFQTPSPANMKFFTDMFGLNSNGSISMPKASLFNIGTWKRSQSVITEAYEKYQEKRKRLKKK